MVLKNGLAVLVLLKEDNPLKALIFQIQDRRFFSAGKRGSYETISTNGRLWHVRR